MEMYLDSLKPHLSSFLLIIGFIILQGRENSVQKVNQLPSMLGSSSRLPRRRWVIFTRSSWPTVWLVWAMLNNIRLILAAIPAVLGVRPSWLLSRKHWYGRCICLSCKVAMGQVAISLPLLVSSMHFSILHQGRQPFVADFYGACYFAGLQYEQGWK